MQKTIYISDNDQGLFLKAQEMLGESSTSSTIVAALKYVIDHKANETSVFELKEGPGPNYHHVKIYGREIMKAQTVENQDFPIYRAFITNSGKVIISIEDENSLVWIKKYNDNKSFRSKAKTEIPTIIFDRVDFEIIKYDPVEIIE